MTYKIKVVFENNTLILDAQKGEKLMDVLIRNRLPVHAPCGGRGVCGKCLVKAEGAYHKDAEAPDGYLLLCRSTVEGDITLYLSHENAEILADYDRSSMETDGETGLGIAVDIGTTTLAAFLMDLKTGKVLSSETMLNPQRSHGADVVSRIAFSIENDDNALLLKNEIEGAIASLTESLLKKSSRAGEKIKKYSFAGNTAMMHFLGGYSAQGISAAPFTPFYTEQHVVPYLGCEAFLGGCISGYVGADTLSCMLASGFEKTDKTILLIDIGTNGEIALIKDGSILTCSCAAGPAFEGAHIACGTGAVKGAIDHAKMENGRLSYSTIQNAPASGICGSGLIDIVSELVKEEVISFMGRIDENYYFTSNVYLSKEDVREVQLAKAAISAGIEILVQEAGITMNDIDECLIAGGFGNFINLSSACAIGLLPKSLFEKMRPIGNAAGVGARMTLLSENARKNLALIQQKSRYIELAAHPDFADLYAENLPFLDPDEI